MLGYLYNDLEDLLHDYEDDVWVKIRLGDNLIESGTVETLTEVSNYLNSQIDIFILDQRIKELVVYIY